MSEPRPGHQARMISVMIERVMAGEDAEAVARDYGPWEWDAPPDLKPIANARARIAELEPVVEAARAWRHAQPLGHYDITQRLAAAVDCLDAGQVPEPR